MRLGAKVLQTVWAGAVRVVVLGVVGFVFLTRTRFQTLLLNRMVGSKNLLDPIMLLKNEPDPPPHVYN